jgi:hypothetical protein
MPDHGSEFSEHDLPVHNLATLLRKYILSHIETPNNRIQRTQKAGGLL